eukprot:1195411-Prorocentrum_minimum.AAC.3
MSLSSRQKSGIRQANTRASASSPSCQILTGSVGGYRDGGAAGMLGAAAAAVSGERGGAGCGGGAGRLVERARAAPALCHAGRARGAPAGRAARRRARCGLLPGGEGAFSRRLGCLKSRRTLAETGANRARKKKKSKRSLKT